ncbi:hypothetical protein, partial [Lysinibacillus sp. NPDC059133]|uniref:hypothetical protein n=1 Tax=Lysinibacillus sp. NPDC059133 TaxID=3346737 RepID=UPI00369F38E4
FRHFRLSIRRFDSSFRHFRLSIRRFDSSFRRSDFHPSPWLFFPSLLICFPSPRLFFPSLSTFKKTQAPHHQGDLRY